MRPRPIIQALLLCSFVSFSAVADDDNDDDDSGVPGFIKGPIVHQIYDGVTDDLLTAGLGKTGLAGAVPGFVDPAKPTAAELRRHAIYSNYRALVDITSGGGYGVLYGPNIDNNGNNTLGEGKIAGDEFLAFADNGTGKRNITLLKNGDPLPPSQVVRTMPRPVVGGVVQPISTANVPAISQTPANDARITFVNGVVQIPE